MKKLNKKLALAMLSLGFAALTPSVASADSCAPKSCDPCNTSSDCWSFDVGVDFLYWKPCVDDLDYSATVSGNAGNIDTPLEVRYNSVCPDWEPGFRIALKKESAWKSFDLSFSYTWLESSDSQSSHAGNGEHIAAVGVHPFLVGQNAQTNDFYDIGKGKWKLNYQTFDILLSYPFRCGSCHTISPFFGVEIVKLDQEWKGKFEYHDTATENPLNSVAAFEWKSDYKGAGLKLGTDYNYLLCDGLSLFARASGTIAIGDADTCNHQAAYQVGEDGSRDLESYIDFKDGDCCHVVPGCHLQLGLQYEDDTCGCEYKLRLGYEMVKWYNLQNPRRWFDEDGQGNIAQSTHSNTTTLGFHGLLAGIEVKF